MNGLRHPLPALAAVLLALGLALAPLSGCAPGRDAAPAAPDRTVTASLLAAADAVVPGRALELVWRFQLAEGWHLYWTGLNDSGFAPVLDLTLPPGWTADPPLWPMPARHLSPGGILDHIYERELVLRQTVRPPADLAPGRTVRLDAALSWLVCREACVPGDTLLTLELPVAETSSPTRGAALAAGVLLPEPAPAGLVSARRDGDVLHLEVPGAAALEFYPDAHCVGLVDPASDGAAAGDALRLRLRDGGGTLCGLLSVKGLDAVEGAYEVHIPADPTETRSHGGTP